MTEADAPVGRDPGAGAVGAAMRKRLAHARDVRLGHGKRAGVECQDAVNAAHDRQRGTAFASSRLSALGSRLSALGFRLWALGFRLWALGFRLLASCFLLRFPARWPRVFCLLFCVVDFRLA